jgi:hypothetical protein
MRNGLFRRQMMSPFFTLFVAPWLRSGSGRARETPQCEARILNQALDPDEPQAARAYSFI